MLVNGSKKFPLIRKGGKICRVQKERIPLPGVKALEREGDEVSNTVLIQIILVGHQTVIAHLPVELGKLQSLPQNFQNDLPGAGTGKRGFKKYPDMPAVT